MKKAITILSAIFIIAALLPGCGGSQKADSQNDVVEITWWNYPNFAEIAGGPGAYEKKLIEAFNKKHPNIKVKVEMLSFNGGPDRVTAAIASNTQPDLIYDYPGRIIDYARSGKMAKMNDMFTEDFKKDIPQTVLGSCALAQDYYMYPFNTAPFMMAFNKTMLEKAGIAHLLPLDRPDRSWTVEEYQKLLEAIKEKIPGVAPVAFYCKSTQGDQGTRAFVANLYGARVIDEQLTAYRLNTPEAVKGLEWIKKGVDSGLVGKGGESLTSNDVIDLFLQQKAASTPLYSVVLRKTFAGKKQDNFEDVLVPFPTPGKPALEAYIGGFGIFNNSDKKVAAAKKLIAFICNDPEWGRQNLIATGGLSVRKSLTGLYDDNEARFSEKMVPYITTYYNHVPGFAEMRTYWFPELQGVLAGKVTPQQAMDNFVQKANATLKK